MKSQLAPRAAVGIVGGGGHDWRDPRGLLHDREPDLHQAIGGGNIVRGTKKKKKQEVNKN